MPTLNKDYFTLRLYSWIDDKTMAMPKMSAKARHKCY